MKEQQEAMIICDQQNQACHSALEKATAEPVQSSWSLLVTTALVGIIGGMVIEHQWGR